MYLTIIFLPCLISILSLVLGKFIGKNGVTVLTVTGILISLFLSLITFYEVALSSLTCNIIFYKWLDLGLIVINIAFFFDTLTTVMLLVVLFISLMVHIYSIDYMRYDPSYNRYMSYLSLFTFFMLLLVTANNFLQMFIGWEGVGLSSYLLISFWYTRILANKAAIKAMFINRLGDLSLLIGISIIFVNLATLNYNVLFNVCEYYLNSKYYFLNLYVDFFFLSSLFLFIGAMGKSAQLGLHTWLPDAMEGPTPVSALIHAATMVTAGVFLVIRCSFFFEQSENILTIVGLIGGMTCFFFSIVGVFQYDIKKIVAYSTCSQLGYMFFSCGLSNYNISLFHLFNHAFFKALLFLSMGSIIHAMLDEQDFRKMGGLIRILPFTYISVFIGSLALTGFPFLTGFYSKDFLLEFAYSRYTINSIFFFFLGIFAAFFTSYYSTRLIYWIFFAKPNFFKSNIKTIHEPTIYMFFPLLMLSFFSIFIGYFFSESFNGVGSYFWSNSIYINYLHFSYFDSEFSLFFIKYLPLVFSLLGLVLFFYFLKNKKFFFKYIYINKFFMKALFFDIIFDYIFLNLLHSSYIYLYKYIEKYFFENIIHNIFIYYVYRIFYFLIKFDSGLVYNYIFLIIYFFIFFFLLFEYSNFFNLIFIFFILNIFLNVTNR